MLLWAGTVSTAGLFQQAEIEVAISSLKVRSLPAMDSYTCCHALASFLLSTPVSHVLHYTRWQLQCG